MSTDRADLKLRFRAGEFEQQLIYLILALQAVLGAMVVVMAVGSVWLSLASSNPITHFSGAVPVLAGMAVAIYLLDRLYE